MTLAPGPTLTPHFIGGQLRRSPSQTVTKLSSPLDGCVLGEVHEASPAELEEAVQLAQQAFLGWKRVAIKDRVQVLYRFKALCEANIGELSELISREGGKTVPEAEAALCKGLEVVEYACSIPNLGLDALLEVSSGVDCYTRRFPLGVVAGITPFNFPAMVPMWMFPIAIACGNSFILKPSEQVPLTPIRLAELLAEAGLPAGVFSVIQGGKHTVEAILEHPCIKAVAFVGSTPIAHRVFELGTAFGKRVLALGGAKNHLVVMPDADIEVTARNVVASAVGCAGQRCMAASVLIAVGDCERVLEAIEREMDKVIPGENLGAIISKGAQSRIEGYIGRAAEGGARLRRDGRSPQVPGKEGGHYVGPTLIDNLERDSEAVRDEIFGPVLSVLRVGSLDEAIEIENASPYGNAAAIYTSSGANALHFEMNVNAGMVGINIGVPVPREPFGFGGWNASRFGSGDITGRDGVNFWTQQRKVTRKWSAAASRNWMS